MTQEIRRRIAARNLLAIERASYEIGGANYERARVVKEATAKAEALVRAKAVVSAKQQTLDALGRAVDEAQARIASAAGQRETYGMRLAQLRANAENVAIRQELAAGRTTEEPAAQPAQPGPGGDARPGAALRRLTFSIRSGGALYSLEDVVLT